MFEKKEKSCKYTHSLFYFQWTLRWATPGNKVIVVLGRVVEVSL